MRALHSADWHIDSTKNLDRHVAALRQMVLSGIENNVDLFLFTGDYSGMDAPHYMRTKEILSLADIYLLAASFCSTLIIPGNHDEVEQFRIFERLAHPNLHVVREFDTKYLTTKSGERVGVIAIPWLPKTAILDGVPVGSITENNEQSSIALINEVTRRVESLDTVDTTIVAAHYAVPGGIMGSIEVNSKHDLVFDTPKIADLPIDYIALGHLHRRQSIPGNRRTWYPGSPCPVDFGETSQRGCNLVDITDHKLKVSFQKISSWEMKTIECTYNGVSIDGDFPDDCTDMQIRLNVQVQGESRLTRNSPAFEKVRRLLQKRGAFHVKPNIQSSKALPAKTPSIISETTTEARLQRALVEQGYDSETRDRLFALFESVRTRRSADIGFTEH